jgi:Kelch motif
MGLGTLGGRAAHTASVLADGRVLVAGGCIADGCTNATPETFLIDADGTMVTAGPTMVTPRDGHTANVVAGQRVVLIGGYPGEGSGVLSSIEMFGAGIITPQTNLAQARGCHASANVGDGEVLVVGGWIRSRTYTATTELFDAETGSVTQMPDLPWAADAVDAVALLDGRVLVTGGQIAAGVPTAEAAIYDPATRRWVSVAPMRTARLKHFSVVLSDGRVLVMGGDIGNESISVTTEIFNPTTLTFTRGPDLGEPRYKFPGGAVALDDVRVLVAGGGRSAEVLDVSSGRTNVVGEPQQVGSFATLSRLGNGDFIIIGGYDDQINLRGTAIIIDSETVGDQSG